MKVIITCQGPTQDSYDKITVQEMDDPDALMDSVNTARKENTLIHIKTSRNLIAVPGRNITQIEVKY